MSRWLKRIGLGLGVFVVLSALGVGIFAYVHASAFDESANRVYDVPLPTITRSADPAVLARGKHLAESMMPCLASGCHGADLAGGKTEQMGPIGVMTAPNVTEAGLGAAYSDAELARLLTHGVKKDGRTVMLMPSHETSWMPQSDVVAVISYVRTLPAVTKPNGPLEWSTFAKVLDRLDKFPLDVARRVDVASIGKGPAPSATPAYGEYVAKLCQGCHGAQLSGGPIPGGPPGFLPSNLTPHETGLGSWTFTDFERALVKAERRDGTKLSEMMPTEAFGKLDATEMRALWEYLRTIPATPYGNR